MRFFDVKVRIESAQIRRTAFADRQMRQSLLGNCPAQPIRRFPLKKSSDSLRDRSPLLDHRNVWQIAAIFFWVAGFSAWNAEFFSGEAGFFSGDAEYVASFFGFAITSRIISVLLGI